MATIRWLDEIDRLFDEMVRGPWTRPQPQAAPKLKREDTQLDVELPVGAGGRGDVSVAIHGNRLVVSLTRASRSAQAQPGGTMSRQQQERVEKTFVLPEDTDIQKVEAHFEGDILRIRIALAPEKD
jgi:HSP20 family molecular chaperone IbpA